MTIRILKSLALAATLGLTGLATPASAVPEGNTLKLSFGNYIVYGTYTQRSCAAQSSVRSLKRKPVGFSIYWLPGRTLYLLTQHPQAGKVRGTQPVTFRFPNGQSMAFNMKRQGKSLFTDIGFGGQAKSFYKLIESSPSMRIEWPALGDAVDVPLNRRRELESAMRHCRDWLKS